MKGSSEWGQPVTLSLRQTVSDTVTLTVSHSTQTTELSLSDSAPPPPENLEIMPYHDELKLWPCDLSKSNH